MIDQVGLLPDTCDKWETQAGGGGMTLESTDRSSSVGKVLQKGSTVHGLIHTPLNHSRSQSHPQRITPVTIHHRNRFTPETDSLPQLISPATNHCCSRNESLPHRFVAATNHSVCPIRTPASRPGDALGRRTALLARDWPRSAAQQPRSPVTAIAGLLPGVAGQDAGGQKSLPGQRTAGRASCARLPDNADQMPTHCRAAP